MIMDNEKLIKELKLVWEKDPFYIHQELTDIHAIYLFVQKMLFDKTEFNCSSVGYIFDFDREKDNFYEVLHEISAYKHYKMLKDVYLPRLKNLTEVELCHYNHPAELILFRYELEQKVHDFDNFLPFLYNMPNIKAQHKSFIKKMERLINKFLWRMSRSAHYLWFEKDNDNCVNNHN
jgi:hypothetical protein